MATLTPLEIAEVTKAVEEFNYSPWNEVFGSLADLDTNLKKAEEKGVAVVKEDLRCEDIRNYHREEASCGNI